MSKFFQSNSSCYTSNKDILFHKKEYFNVKEFCITYFEDCFYLSFPIIEGDDCQCKNKIVAQECSLVA